MASDIQLPDLTALPDRALVTLYGAVMAELLERGVVRSANNPIADMAERVVADYYGVEPAPPNEKAYDVKTKDGVRIQVKALRRTHPSSSSLSPLRDLDFECVAIVIFKADMELVEVALVPVAVVKEYMGWSKTWGCHRLSATKKLLADPRVQHITRAQLLTAA